MKNSIYLSNLEQWIDKVILQDGLTDRQIAIKVIDSFKRSMQANMDYHELMATKSDIDEQKRRHSIMIEVYKELKGT